MATAAAAAAQTTYSGKGYDISYPNVSAPPNCTSSSLPTGAFGIVGVNHGRPFSNNGCFSQEFAYASTQTGRTPSLYINTAYSGAYRKNITPYCAQQTQSMAWQIGCSEADTSFRYAGQPSVGSVTMWWLDVETGNSWSSSNLSLNQAAINGAADFLSGKGFQVGVYSTGGMWQTITGTGFTPVHSVGDWVAGQGGSCPGTSFDANPVWLSQSTSGFDFDTACP